MRKKREEERPAGDPEEPAPWVRLVQAEIGLRMEADRAESDATLDRELELLARMRARYPDIPVDLAVEFGRRLNAGSFTSGAWDSAVAWLETTDWARRPDA